MGYCFLILLNVLIIHSLVLHRNKMIVRASRQCAVPLSPTDTGNGWGALSQKAVQESQVSVPPGNIVITRHSTLQKSFKGLYLSSKHFLFGCN